jgi:beta-glucosidase
MVKMKFPKGFCWGTSTSAHQIEGGNINNDWYDFEKIPGKITEGHNSEVAANSWNEWKKDVELLKETNQNAYRFSIEWSKIEPKKGKFDYKVIAQYKHQLQYLHDNNIKTMVTLFHFTLPRWVSDEGGMSSKITVKNFIEFVDTVVPKLDSLVDFWIVLNEPNVYALHGYITGIWAPGIKNWYLAYKTWLTLVSCQNAAARRIKKINPKAMVGIAMNFASYEPKRKNNIFDLLFVQCVKMFSHDIFTRLIIKNCDFLGVNCYLKFILQTKKPYIKKSGTARSDFGWGVFHNGLYEVLIDQAKWHKPIFITENGISDAKDKQRPRFIKDSLEQTYQAIQKGVDVRGYFYWSLMDNFEWAAGYTQKFGLFTIDRQARPSAKIYADLIKKYSIESENKI